MDDYRSMSTPLVTNWMKIDASSLEEFDPTLYRQLIGSLMYLVNTRLGNSFAVNSLSHFVVDPRRVQWTAVKHVLHYIRGTVEYELVNERSGSVQLAGFTNAGWARCVEEHFRLLLQHWVKGCLLV